MKKIISIILIVFTLTVGTMPAFAASSPAPAATTISPNFTGISILSISLTINPGGLSTSTGSVRPSSSSYTSYLTVGLQKYTSSGWTTIKSWSGSGTGLSGAIAGGSYYVASSTYRSFSTATVYSSSGSLLDTETAYSAEKTY